MRRGSSPLARLIAINLMLIAVVLVGAWWLLGRQPADTSTTSPSMAHHQFQAASDQLATLLVRQGPAAFDHARQRMAADPSFARDCHPLMHALGHAAYDHYGSYAKASELQDEMCNSGYIHGLIEASFSQATDIGQAVQTTCPSSDRQDLRQWQCYHGIGHGLMLVSGRQLSKSVGQCQRLPSEFAVKACVNGVYMEHFIAIDHTGHARTGASASFGACQQAAATHKSACYYYAPTAYLSLRDGRYAAAYSWCRQAAETEYIGSCVSGIGGQAMKDNVTQPSLVAAICTSVAIAYRDQCVDGAIGTYINIQASSAAAMPLCVREFRDVESVCRYVVELRRQRFAI